MTKDINLDDVRRVLAQKQSLKLFLNHCFLVKFGVSDLIRADNVLHSLELEAKI